MDKIPAISGKQLIKLLKKDGWKVQRRANHGVSLSKYIGGHYRVTVIPDTRSSLPRGTLGAILGNKQTGLHSPGLANLILKYGR